MSFDRAFELLLDPQHEGFYSNDANDPGGETLHGIARRRNPQWEGWSRVDGFKALPDFPQSMRGNTELLTVAKNFYRTRYWGPAGCDLVADLAKYQLFDMAVNCGVTTAIKAMQAAVGATADGVIGPQTTLKVSNATGDWLLRRLQAQAIRHYADLKTWPLYGRGWMLRLAANMESP